jgi:hypothetical protein
MNKSKINPRDRKTTHSTWSNYSHIEKSGQDQDKRKQHTGKGHLEGVMHDVWSRICRQSHRQFVTWGPVTRLDDSLRVIKAQLKTSSSRQPCFTPGRDWGATSISWTRTQRLSDHKTNSCEIRDRVLNHCIVFGDKLWQHEEKRNDTTASDVFALSENMKYIWRKTWGTQISIAKFQLKNLRTKKWTLICQIIGLKKRSIGLY